MGFSLLIRHGKRGKVYGIAVPGDYSKGSIGVYASEGYHFHAYRETYGQCIALLECLELEFA